MPSKLQAALALSVLSLAAALFVPVFIDATGTNSVDSAELSEGQTANITDRLSVTADVIDTTSNTANYTLRNEDTLNTTTTSLGIGSNETVSLSGENITVTHDRITSDNTTVVTLDYSPMFGWNDSARTFIQNMDIVLAALAILMILVLTTVVFR